MGSKVPFPSDHHVVTLVQFLSPRELAEQWQETSGVPGCLGGSIPGDGQWEMPLGGVGVGSDEVAGG